MSPRDILSRVASIDWEGSKVSVLLASLPHSAELPTVHALNMTSPLASEFRRIARDVTQALDTSQRAGDLVLSPFDAGFKPDSHEVEWLQIAELDALSQTLDCIPKNVANATIFAPDDTFLSFLHFYVIVIDPPKGKRLLFFRKYSFKRELGRSQFFGALFARGQFDTISEPLFLFDDRIDCFATEGHMFVLRKHDFQLIFRFFELLRDVADETLQAIREKVPIANFDEFAESCRTHLQKLAKLKNIAAKPYLQIVTMAVIKRTIKAFKLEGVRVVGPRGKEQLEFDPSNRWEILKLLDDDYLGSLMTKLRYEVNSKKPIG